MTQRQFEELGRLQVRDFLSTNKKLRGEYAQFKGAKPIVNWLSTLNKHVQDLVESGDALISAAQKIPNCANRSPAVAEAKENGAARFKYVTNMRDMKLAILKNRKQGLYLWAKLKEQLLAKGSKDEAKQLSINEI